jgi:trigger factor
MVERHRDRRLAAARRRLEGAVPEEALDRQLEQWKEAWRTDAEREVRELLLLEAVAEQEGLEASEADVAARIAELAREQGVSAGELRKSLGEEAIQSAVRARLVEEKALEFLQARAKVEEATDS